MIASAMRVPGSRLLRASKRITRTMLRRNSADRRYRERIAGSYLASLFLHLLFAAFFISAVANSSQEGATENAIGGQLVTLEARAPAVANVPVPVRQAAPVPHAAVIAPLARPVAARPARQLRQPARPELSKFAPTAPPNPTPLPQATAAPNIQPSVAAYEVKPQTEVPAVPTTVPAEVVAVTVKIPPTAVPTAAPTIGPSVPPQTPKPAGPSPIPSAAIVAAAKPTAHASASPAPAPRSTSSPAPTAGAPTPTATRAPEPAKAQGLAPSPGPSGHALPGPIAGNARTAKPAPPRAVNVAPTPRPKAPSPSRPSIDLNARLRAMLPNNPVSPSMKTYRQDISLSGRLEPTPPPDVVAATRFIFEERGVGHESRIKMWVTDIFHIGPATYCYGWLLRYPVSPNVGFMHPSIPHIPDANGAQLGGIPSGEMPPIVEAGTRTLCSTRDLVPFAPSPVPSP